MGGRKLCGRLLGDWRRRPALDARRRKPGCLGMVLAIEGRELERCGEAGLDSVRSRSRWEKTGVLSDRVRALSTLLVGGREGGRGNEATSTSFRPLMRDMLALV